MPALLTLRARTESLGAKLRRVDWAGGALFMGSATRVLVAVSWGGVQHAWDSAATVAPLVAGVVGTAATVVWERRFAAEPLFHRSIFRDASSVSVYVCAAIQGMLVRESSDGRTASFPPPICLSRIIHPLCPLPYISPTPLKTPFRK